MSKRFLLSWLAVFVAWMVGSFIVHGLILKPSYAQVPELFRTQDETAEVSHFMLLAHVIMAGAFAWIYQRGVDARPWLPQGLRFGIAIALLAPVPTYMIYYVVQPMPATLVIQQALYDGILVVVLALLVAYINKPSQNAI